MSVLTSPAIPRAAAALLRQRGWVRGKYIDARGCMCMVGALRVAAGGTVGPQPGDAGNLPYENTHAYQLVMRTLEDMLDVGFVTAHRYTCLSEWNDDQSRTAAQVLDALEQAAVRLEKGIESGIEKYMAEIGK